MTEIKYCVGVDIASSTFTAAVGEMPWKTLLKPQTFENAPDGYQQLLEWFAQYHLAISQTVVCMEATGVYSEGLAYFLYVKGYRVAVQSPLEVKRTFSRMDPRVTRWTAYKSPSTPAAILTNWPSGSPEARF